MLEIGTRQNMTGAFSKDMIMRALFPDDVRKTLNTLQQLGLTGEIDRFTTTLATASERAATSSVPVFVTAINRPMHKCEMAPDSAAKSGGFGRRQLLFSRL